MTPLNGPLNGPINGLVPCIISGGSGTRLWPVSRQNMPKPFMRMRDDQSLLQKTFQSASQVARRGKRADGDQPRPAVSHPG